MDAARLREDLKGLFRGELLLDDISRTLYSTDASLFRLTPLGAAVPRDEADLQALVRYAAEHAVPLIARGAGTGVSGEALGNGLIVDLSVHLRAIVAIGSDTVTVQPGVVHRTLNEELAKQGRRFAPDTASGSVCTIGGMLATNASGSRSCLHGTTADHVAALRVVWDNGQADRIMRPTSAHIGEGANGDLIETAEQRTPVIRKSVSELLRTNLELVAASRSRSPFDRCGYHLHDVLGPKGLDLPRLLVGSEGTLAFFTEATLRTIPLPGGRSAVLFAFASLDSALRACQLVRSTAPAACDLLDRRVLTLTRAHSAELTGLIPPAAEAILLVEYERDSQAEAKAAALEIIERIQADSANSIALPAHDEEGIKRLWQVRDGALPGLYAIGRGARPLAFVEDVGVAPEDLAEFMTRVQAILKKAEVTASFVIHAAAGQIHTRPFLDLDNPVDSAKLWPLAEQIHGLALEMGGSVTTQHGTGIARTPWVERQAGRLFPIYQEVKRIFDPRGILNPGKIVGLDPSRPAWPLRTVERQSAEKQGDFQSSPVAVGAAAPLLRWHEREMADEVSACNGCGDCRAEDPTRRMCPIFRVSHHEAATPRAKANLLRELLAAGGDPTKLSAEEVRDVADLCVNCKMCASECSARVNVPKLMLEAKASNQAEHGLSRSDWVLARTEGFAALGSNFAVTANKLLSSRIVRWVLERLVGVSRHRRLPAFAARNFLKLARRKGWTRKKPSSRRAIRVAYFVDVFANFNDPLIAESAVAVLHHHGIEVFVPPDQRGCGMAPLAQGDLETARESMTRNLRVFADLVREGYTIVCSEPTGAIVFRHDAASVIDDPDVRLVAENTVELSAFLWNLHAKGQLRTDFTPLDLALAHHVPCHVKALGMGVHGPGLLSLIPELRVRTIDVSCSGMAGTFGLKSANFATSLEAGRPMLNELNRVGVMFGSTECSACRMQMEQGSGKRTLHPVQYLALAYGLVPEVAALLKKPVRGLVSP